jgi:hypothetical protein
VVRQAANGIALLVWFVDAAEAVPHGPADPVAASIVRAAGINVGRRCVRYRDGEFRAES